MGFRFRRKRSTRGNFHSAIAASLEDALRALAPATRTYSSEAVHEARRSVKKARAALRLAVPELHGRLKRADRQLQRAGRALSGLRDADVLRRTFEHLRARYRALAGADVDRVGRALASGTRRGVGRRQQIQRALRRLTRVSSDVERWRFGGDGFSGLRQGLKAGYRNAQEAFAAVKVAPTDERFHEWRKQVTRHWYHARLLRRMSAGMRDRCARARQLQRTLGLDHDLAVLKARLMALNDGRLDRPIQRLCQAIDRYQARVRHDALAIGSVLFQDPPRAFVRQARDDWKCWRRGLPAGAPRPRQSPGGATRILPFARGPLVSDHRARA